MALKYSKSSLVVKNLTTRDIKVLGMRIKRGKQADLFDAVVGLTEDRVIAAMQKPNGELYKAVARGSISIGGSKLATFENDTGITVYRTLTVTSSTAATIGSVFLCDATEGNIVISLPPASSAPGRVIQVKKIDSSLNTVTLQCDAGDTLDGAANFVISDEYFSLSVVSSGTNYYII